MSSSLLTPSLQRTLAIVSIASGIANMGLYFSILNTILAVIAKDLHASTLELQWILNIYGLFIAPFLVIMGRLGDKFGYKKIFILGLLFLIISALGTALSPNPIFVILFQAFFGLAGAILLPLSQVLLLNLFPADKKNTAMGIWTSSGGLALAFGPITAGLLSLLGDWRIPFFLISLVALISLILALFLIQEPERKNPPSLDILGTFLLMLTIGVFILAIMQTGTWSNLLVLGLYVLSIILLLVLIQFEKNVPTPILQTHLFTQRNFLCAASANALMIFYAWVFMFLIPLYLQITQNFSLLKTGLLMLFLTLPLTLVSNLAGQLYYFSGPKFLISLGYFLMILCSLLGLFFQPHSSLILIILANLSFGLAWGLVMVPAATTAMQSLDHDNAGAGAGSFNTLQEIGGVVGLTIVVTIVRLHSNFITGLHQGFLTLLVFSLIGLLFAWGLKLKN